MYATLLPPLVLEHQCVPASNLGAGAKFRTAATTAIAARFGKIDTKDGESRVSFSRSWKPQLDLNEHNVLGVTGQN